MRITTTFSHMPLPRRGPDGCIRTESACRIDPAALEMPVSLPVIMSADTTGPWGGVLGRHQHDVTDAVAEPLNLGLPPERESGIRGDSVPGPTALAPARREARRPVLPRGRPVSSAIARTDNPNGRFTATGTAAPARRPRQHIQVKVWNRSCRPGRSGADLHRRDFGKARFACQTSMPRV